MAFTPSSLSYNPQPGSVAESAPSGAQGAALAAPKFRDIFELSTGYGLILLALWTPAPWERVFYWSALAWILSVTFFPFSQWKRMSLSVAGFLRSLWVVGAALLLAGAAMIIASRVHPLHRPHGVLQFFKSFSGYVVWSLLQQFLLQSFVLLRLLRLLPRTRVAVIGAASLFAIAHLPNPVLTPVTLIWGLIACALFLKYRNIYTLGMAHAVLGICMAISVPGPVDHNMRVGLGYLKYHLPRHHRSQSDQTVSTKAWVVADAPTRRS